MLCKRCLVIMKSGTTYEQKNQNNKRYKRFNKCPKCHEKIYNNSPNPQGNY